MTPCSTLFPYTTLFRSLSFNPGIDYQVVFVSFDPREKPDMAAEKKKTALDRKSTRLNSSHRCISYAVFCLKKKTPASSHWPRRWPQSSGHWAPAVDPGP